MSTKSNPIIIPLTIVESMTESVLITTSDLDAPGPFIIYVNPAFEKMTGWKRKEVIGKTPRILQGEKTEKSIFVDLRKNLNRGQIWRGQTTNYKKDGSEFIMEWSIVPIRNDQGQIDQHLAVQRDVTTRVIMERKLDEAMAAQKMRSEELRKVNRELKHLNEEQKKTLNLFIKYVPEPIVKKALKEESHTIFEGEQLDISLLFCDIRNFTSISERISPNEVVFLLNSYYSVMAEVINKHMGNIGQFVGDEIFVTFGAPYPVANCEEHALNCAIEMLKALDRLNGIVKKSIKEEIKVGIGINHGPVVAGNLGSDDRLSYSITGDAVNTAKRIEALTKGRPNTILISQTIYDKTRQMIQVQHWDAVDIKGKDEKVKVYEVLGQEK